MEDAVKEVRNKTIGMAATVREKAAFDAFCEEKGLKPGQMLRLMVSRVCPSVVGDVESVERTLKDTPLFLRLDKADAIAVRDRAQREGTTPQGWIRRLIRSMLHQTPQFSRVEENALLESNRELAHLGRNINQIAHQLNISLNATDQVHAGELAALVTSINKHRRKVAELINASWGRYGGEGEV